MYVFRIKSFDCRLQLGNYISVYNKLTTIETICVCVSMHVYVWMLQSAMLILIIIMYLNVCTQI